MKWYPAILNILDTEDVTIKGEALIDVVESTFGKSIGEKIKMVE